MSPGKISPSLQRFISRLFTPVDNTPLVLFRILFGFLMFYDVVSKLLSGTAYNMFVKPGFVFTFIGFEFLERLHGPVMYYYLGVMALLSLMIAAGFFYRFAIIAHTLLFAGTYFMAKGYYQNHYYLVLLINFLLIFAPANGNYSVDAQRKPALRSNVCPQWCCWIFIAQVIIVYWYSAIHKMYPDWLNGTVMKLFFPAEMSGKWIAWVIKLKGFHLFISYFVIVFDIGIIFLFLNKKTREAAFCLSLLFHLFNSFAFKLGIFPYLALSLNIFFFDSNELRRFFQLKNPATASTGAINTTYRKATLAFLAGYLMFQVIAPLSHLLFRGQPNWEQEGFRLSWRLKTRVKEGRLTYNVFHPATNKRWIINPADSLGKVNTSILAISPDMIWQYARHLKKCMANKGYPDTQIFAVNKATLNGRPFQYLVNPAADLGKAEWRRFKHDNWIMPLQ